MVTQANKEIVVAAGEFHVSKNPRELLKAIRVASSIVVVAFDPESRLGGMAHMALPDSRMTYQADNTQMKYVDIALPLFIQELLENGLIKTAARIKIIGGSQLFNFGGGAGNILNIGARNAITARTILSREGIQVEKTETGGNKPRNVLLDMSSGSVQVSYPGETPRYL
jgi:chemotaxis protein CheD